MQAKIVFGTLGAVGAAIVGAVAWSAITAATGYQIGYMAIAVGFLCGFAMRSLSGGRVPVEGAIAAFVALLGCALGNILASAAAIAAHEHVAVPVAALVILTHPAFAFEVLRSGFDAMDVLFYAIAGYAAYRAALAPRKPTGLPAAPPPAPSDAPPAA